MRITICFLLIALIIQPLSACMSKAADDKISLFVSILPLAYFVERIGGEHVEVHVLVGPGQSPETYEPTSKQLVHLAHSRAFFSVGVPFEEVILARIRSNFSEIEIVNAGSGIKLKKSNRVQGVDPHVWLDPKLAVIIAGNVYIGLAQLDPEHKMEYENNTAALIKDLKNLNEEITKLLAPVQGKKFYVFHPAYGYFADAYGLVQVSIEEGGASPGSKHLASLIEQAKAEKVRAIFTQPQQSSSSAKTIADEIGADIIVLDPLSRDYLTNLKEIALRIKKALDE